MRNKYKKLVSSVVAGVSLTFLSTETYADDTSINDIASMGNSFIPMGSITTSVDGAHGSLPLTPRDSFSSTNTTNNSPLADLVDFFTGGSTSSLRLFEVGTLGSDFNSTMLGSALQSGGSIGSGIRSGSGGLALGSAGSAVMFGPLGNGVESGNSFGRSPFLSVAASYPLGSGTLLGSFNSLIGSNILASTFGIDADSVGAKSYLSPTTSMAGSFGSWIGFFPTQILELSINPLSAFKNIGTDSFPSSLLGIPSGFTEHIPGFAFTTMPFYSLSYLSRSFTAPLNSFVPTVKLGSFNLTGSLHSVKKTLTPRVKYNVKNIIKVTPTTLKQGNIIRDFKTGVCIFGHNGQGGCNGGGVYNQLVEGAEAGAALGGAGGAGIGTVTGGPAGAGTGFATGAAFGAMAGAAWNVTQGLF